MLYSKRLAIGLPVMFLMSAGFSFTQTHSPLVQPKSSKSKSNIATVIATLKNRIPQLMNEGRVPGLSIAVVENNLIAWHQGFGVKNSATNEPVTDTTTFEAASLSKPVFAYAVLKLVDAGKIELDKPLNHYLPGNYDVGDDARISQITARHVLSHTPGFPNWRRPGSPLSIHFTPGERFSYSGEGFVYLAKVIEKITGEKFNDFMTRTVFVPLEMKSSSYVWRNDYDTQAIFRHNAIGEPAGQNKTQQPNAAASLQTTATDYGRFIVAILKGEGLKKTTAKLMLTPQIKVSESGANNTLRAPEKLSPSLAWGLGWGLQTTANGTAFWHWGDNGNSKAYIVANPQKKSGVVVFANSTNGLSIVPEIIGEVLGNNQPALAWLKYETYNSPGKKLFNDILARGAESALRDYRERRKNPQAALDEAQVNRLGYNLITARKLKDAIEVFKMNVEDYPQSANVYDSLAEAYAADGGKALAIKNYERAIELDPTNENAKQTLKKLKEKPE
ncbi:MAG: serine hydrolase [Acidobacteriota bacterium]